MTGEVHNISHVAAASGKAATGLTERMRAVAT
jgi:hypothetical protein